MILHIFNDQIKFSKGYFEFLYEQGFDLSNMELVHYGKRNEVFKRKFNLRTHFIRDFFSPVGNICLIRYLFKADKIIVHSLAAPALLLYLCMFPRLQEKTTWVIWGKDLYYISLIPKIRFYHKIYEWFRIRAIKGIDTIVTTVRGDYEELKRRYVVSGKYIECNVLYFKSFDSTIGEVRDSGKDSYILLLGNSASSSNHHIEALKILKVAENRVDRIYCPLSYGGSKKYTDQVLVAGKELFGQRFVPLIDFLPFDKYKEILAEVDIGVFNHERQEGLANIWSLIFQGKTVYMNAHSSAYSFFIENGIEVKNTQAISVGGLSALSPEKLRNNQARLSIVMSAENSKNSWQQILNMEAK